MCTKIFKKPPYKMKKNTLTVRNEMGFFYFKNERLITVCLSMIGAYVFKDPVLCGASCSSIAENTTVIPDLVDTVEAKDSIQDERDPQDAHSEECCADQPNPHREFDAHFYFPFDGWSWVHYWNTDGTINRTMVDMVEVLKNLKFMAQYADDRPRQIHAFKIMQELGINSDEIRYMGKFLLEQTQQAEKEKTSTDNIDFYVKLYEDDWSL